MKKRIPRTTEEIVASLRASPDYSPELEKRLQQIEADEAAIAREAEPILQALAAHGIRATGIDASLEPYLPLPEPAVEIFLEYLPKVSDIRVKDMMVWYLRTTKVRFDATVLTQVFDTETSMHVKWVIGETIAHLRPRGIEEWLAATLRNREHGKARQMLCFAAARLLPKEEARKILVEVFDDMPGHAAGGLRTVGGADELAFLKSQEPHPTRCVRKAIASAIRGIEKRLEKERNRQAIKDTGKRAKKTR